MPDPIGKHLATFNLFREADNSIHVTCVDAHGVADEITGSGAPLHLCAMNALRAAVELRPSTPTPDSPELERLREALRRIEGGSFPNASTLAIAGDWHGAFTEMQRIARQALSPAVPQEADDATQAVGREP